MENITISPTKRTLTLKSKLGFGKYEELTLEEIIKLGKNSYLRWVYFHYSGIDFIPPILDTIQIPVNYRLVKPAKNPDVLDEVNALAVEKHKFVYTEESKEKRSKAHNTMKPKKFSVDSKAALLRKNHGHR